MRRRPRRAGVVDTSVVHAYLVEDDVHHCEALEVFSCLDEIHLPSIVFHEAIWSLRKRGLDPEHIAALAERLYLTPRIILEPPDMAAMVEAARDARRYADRLVVLQARRLGLPLYTFDHRMARLARRLGVEVHTACTREE